MTQFLSGRQRNLKIGISSFSENTTSLQVTGNVGIGTTFAGSSLYVIGDGRFTGVVTAVTFNGQINAGVATITTISGTAATYSIGNITTLSGTYEYYNVGLITALAGTALTYTTGNITTLSGSNAYYNTGIVTTLSGTYGYHNVGVVTALAGTALTYTTGNITTLSGSNAYYNTGIVTTLSGTNLNYSGIGTIATLNSTNATLTNINSSGITTVGFLTASNVSVSGILTASRLSTGPSGTGINIDTNTISGPAIIYIDPAGVGDNTGAVRIKGDLYVDGTQFIVNSSTIELADLRVGIATTVGTNLLLDGGGIGIGSANILKTFIYNNASNSLKSSENFDIASGKVYKIGGTEVLSSTLLTVANINASGVTTVGFLTASNVYVSGVTTSNAYYIGTSQVISSARQLQNIASLDATTTATIETAIQQAPNDFTSLNITGISTLQSTTLIGGGTSTGTAGQVLQVTGISSSAYIGGDLGIGTTLPTSKLHVDGNVLVSGVSTFIGGGTSANPSVYARRNDNNDAGIKLYGTSGGNWVYSESTSSNVKPLIIDSSQSENILFRIAGGTKAVIQPSGELLVGSATSTGTADQLLQVNSGAYVFGNLGIGITNTSNKLEVIGGDVRFATSSQGDIQITHANLVSTIKGGTTTQLALGGNGAEVVRINSTGVGIGTTNPITTLQVFGGVTSAGGELNLAVTSSDVITIPSTISSASSFGTLQIFGGGMASPSRRGGQIDFVAGAATTNPGSLIFRTGIATGGTSQPEVARFSSSGNLGIGTTNPTSKLHVVGDTYISGILTATDINSASDIRLKTNIKPFENTLEKIVQINGVSFNWIDSNAKSGGIIAQDVEKVFPELVNDGDHKTVNYNGLIGVLVESIKELKQEVEDLKSRLSET